MKGAITTAMSTIQSDDVLLNGTERFPVLGNAITLIEYAKIMKASKGLRHNWNCLEKAEIVQSILKRGSIILGSLLVNSADMKSQFGYYFNPPLEFHAWVLTNDGIIDVSLPGVIEMGLTQSDEYGPFIIGREPVVLAGIPLDWMLYKAHEVYSKGGSN
jgi:hypothetical protein